MQVFKKSPKIPPHVKKYTMQQFDHQDSLMSFLNEYTQPIAFENFTTKKRKAVSVSIKSLRLLYLKHVAFWNLGKPKLMKHLKNMLLRNKYNIVKTKKSLTVRGILLNIDKLTKIYQYQVNELSA